MDNANELLKRALDALDTVDSVHIGKSLLRERIQEFLEAEKEAVPEAEYEPLYLHPPKPEPARKPMPDEEIANCIPPQPKGGMFHMVDGKFGVTKEWLIPLVRAIERHHGIGTEK